MANSDCDRSNEREDWTRIPTTVGVQKIVLQEVQFHHVIAMLIDE